MNLKEWAESVLLSESLDTKLTPISTADLKFFESHSSINELHTPGRSKKIAINNKQDKFPKRGSFSQKENRAKAMHFFANHELLAMEIMAAAILYYPTLNEDDFRLKKGIAHTLMDEQKHFKLYQRRMNQLGVEFGDFSINDFFWRYLVGAKTIQQFICMMSLTFEAANLDFSLYYRDAYQDFNDEDSANVMQEVYDDEVTHVALGVNWIKKWLAFENGKDIWNFYLQNLPEGLSPARGKGIVYDSRGRIRAGLDQDFVNSSENYKDEFNVVNRSTWKQV